MPNTGPFQVNMLHTSQDLASPPLTGFSALFYRLGFDRATVNIVSRVSESYTESLLALNKSHDDCRSVAA